MTLERLSTKLRRTYLLSTSFWLCHNSIKLISELNCAAQLFTRSSFWSSLPSCRYTNFCLPNFVINDKFFGKQNTPFKGKLFFVFTNLEDLRLRQWKINFKGRFFSSSLSSPSEKQGGRKKKARWSRKKWGLTSLSRQLWEKSAWNLLTTVLR